MYLHEMDEIDPHHMIGAKAVHCGRDMAMASSGPKMEGILAKYVLLGVTAEVFVSPFL